MKLTLLFLAIAIQITAQIKSEPMKFSCGKADTIYIQIESDETYSNNKLNVSCSKHKHSDWTSITFGFTDSTLVEVFSASNYTIKDIDKFKSVSFDFISFDEILSSTACVKVRTKDYFIKHFNSVKN